MSDWKVELDAAGNKCPNRQNPDWFHNGIAEKDFLSDPLVEEAINSAAKLRRYLDAKRSILQHDHAKLARHRRGFGISVARIRKQMFAMVDERQACQRDWPVER